MKDAFSNWVLLGSSALAAVVVVGSAAAQTTPPAASAASPSQSTDDTQAAGLADIIVTANKRSENIQRAPVAITAVSGDALRDLGITDARGLQAALPSVEIRPEGPVSQAFIRGVGNNIDLPYTEPAVAYNYNGISIPRYATSSAFFDLAQVESLPGPQGTLYGGTAAGGVINIATRKPGGGLAGEASLEGGAYGLLHGSIGQDLPLTSKLAIRAAVDYNRHSGYQRDNLDSDDKISGRLTAVWSPTDALKITVFGAAFRDAGKPQATVNSPFLVPSNPWFVPLTAPLTKAPINAALSHKDYNNQVVGLQADYSLNGLDLAYLAGYVHVDDNTLVFAADFPLVVNDHENQITQELRLSNDKSSRFSWLLGFYFSHNRIDFLENFGRYPLLTLPRQTNVSYAGFAQGIYRLSDHVRLTVGGRYSSDSKTAAGTGAGGRFTFDKTWTHADYKVGVDADLGNRTLVYATIQTGYLPGAYSPLPRTATFDNSVAPESLWSATAGFKTRTADGRITFNNEAFYYDYKNFQVVALSLATGYTSVANAPRARIFGDQLNLAWKATSSSRLDIGLGLLSAKFTDFALPGLPVYTGFQMANAPTVTLHLGGEQRIPISDRGELVLGVQSEFQTKHYGQYDHFPYTTQASYTRTNASLMYRPFRESWDVKIWVRNLEDAAIFGATAGGGQPGPASVYLDPPRTFGATISYHWK